MDTPTISHFLALLGRNSLEAGILVLLVLALQWLFRRQLTPRWRCALWLLVAGRLLLPFSLSSSTSVFNLLPRATPFELPVAGNSLPARDTSAFAPSQPISTGSHEPGETAGNAALAKERSGPALMSSAPAQAASGWSWAGCFFAIWLAGVVVLGAHVTFSSFRLWRHCAQLPPLPRAWTSGVLRECGERLKLRTLPAILESREIGSPALQGLFRPRLLLPKGFTVQFSEPEQRFVFLHELAHVKRHDLLMNWIIVLLQILHWFNPLVWFGFARWRAERELACDAMALEAAGEGRNKEYGRTILRLLDTLARPLATPGLVGILEDRRQLRQRIGMIASYVPTRGWPRLAMLLIGVLAVVGLTDPRSLTSSAADVAVTPAPSAPTAVIPQPTAPPPIPPATSMATFAETPSNTVLQSVQSDEPVISSTITTSEPVLQKDNVMNPSTITNQVARTVAVGLIALATATGPVVSHAETDSATPPPQPASDLGKQLIGAWVLVGTPDHVGKAPSSGGRIKIFTGAHFCMTQAESKHGVVLFHHGGTYSLNGNAYHETLEFAGPPTINMVGKTNGNFTLKIDGDKLTSIGLDNPWKEVWQRLKPRSSLSSPSAKELTGTWIYAGEPGSTNPPVIDRQRLKFCVDGYWCDTDSDPKTHAVVIHHGGIYSLKNGNYVETCQYANPTTMDLIGEDVKFDFKIEDNTLTLIGKNNPWKEVWQRLD